MPASFWHLVPPIFVSGLAASLGLAFLMPTGWRLVILAGPRIYGLILCRPGFIYRAVRAGKLVFYFLLPQPRCTLRTPLVSCGVFITGHRPPV